jgi:diguanylate cyclase (GGDEF)-like protein
MLRYDASHDELTGIPNRRALMRVLADSTNICLLLIDLDRFKLVNDSLGHDRGDELLRIVADRLRLAIRPGDQIFRQGGDEFAIVVSAPATLTDAKRVASRLCDLLTQPARLGPNTVYPGGSVGIAASSEDIDSSELLRRADTALYRAKSLGGSAAVTFDEALSEEFLHRAGTEAELRGALAENRIITHFQPEISLVDGSLLGAEALARWNHPTEGVLATELFFQIAEKYGVIREIGARVLRDACAQAAGWPDDSVIVRVNLSAEEIVSEHTVDVVRNSLLASGLAPQRLCLEVTELAATNDIDRAEIVMRGLKELGVELTLEDFGTGGSSLAGLRRLPIDSLKIDPSLVGDLGGDDDESVGFVRLITSLADALGLAVVGQGVQTEAEADVLRVLGCASAQGDLFGPVAPLADLLAMMT